LDEMDRVGAGGSWQPLCEELGDLLFQIVFQAQLAEEKGQFTLADVGQAIADKIERRHPHVFGGRTVSGTQEVSQNWAQLKAEERRRKKGNAGSVLDGVPSMAPALLRAERLTEKASRIGFDWPDLAGVRAKLEEELAELDEAIALSDRDQMEHELGDVLFSLANLARFIKTPPEDALRQAIRRFISRFGHIETRLAAEGIPFGQASLEQMEQLWQQAKKHEHLLPPPQKLPRATLVSLRFSVADIANQRRFWDLLAPELGWQLQPAAPGEAQYTDGSLSLTFWQSSPADSSSELSLQAPSLAALENFRQALSRLGVSALVQKTGEGRWAVPFQDFAGLRWRYAF
jgi:nucleoside triphosphate diphosphatase